MTYVTDRTRRQPKQVWRRRSTDEPENRFGERAFAGGIAALTGLAIGITLLGQQYTQSLGIRKDTAGVLVWVLVIAALIGAVMMAFSRKPAFSFVGLMTMAFSFGLFVGTLEPGIAFRPLVASLAVVAVLAPVGWFVKADLQGWLSWLLGLTMALIVMSLLMPLVHSFSANAGPYERPEMLDWATVLVFSGWVIYDWNRARRMPRTLDNMIDGAGGVYLDWLNLYLAFRNIGK